MKNFGTFIKYFDAGRNNIFGRVFGIVQLVLTLAIYLKIDGEEIGLIQIGLFGLLLLFLLFVGGFLYVKLGLFRSENQSRNYDNPEVMEILYNTRRILKK